MQIPGPRSGDPKSGPPGGAWGSALLHGLACRALCLPSNNPLQDGGLGDTEHRHPAFRQKPEHVTGCPTWGQDASWSGQQNLALTWPSTSDVTCLGNSWSFDSPPAVSLTAVSRGVTSGTEVGHPVRRCQTTLVPFLPLGPTPPPSEVWGRGAFKGEVRKTEERPSGRSTFLLTF